jgi:Dockerin type I domain
MGTRTMRFAFIAVHRETSRPARSSWTRPYLPVVGTFPQCGTCAADINLDGTVNGWDLAALLPLWNDPFTRCQPMPYADLNADNRVNWDDVRLLVHDWGACAQRR